MLWSIAWKNIWRNKLRTFIVITAIALGLLAGMFTSAVMLGIWAQRMDTSINREVSHIQIHNPKFILNKEIQYTLQNPDKLIRDLNAIPEIKAVSARTKILGMVSSAASASGIQIIGVDPLAEMKVSTIYKTIDDSSGQYFKHVSRNPIVIGRKLADKLKVRLHSKIVLRFQNDDGMIIDAAFKIAGIYKTSNSVFDEMNVFVRKNDIKSLLGKDDIVHEIAVLLNDGDYLDKTVSEIKFLLPLLNVMSWKELQPDLGYINDILDVYLYIILGIILLALSFGIVNTMLMVVLERVRELGMLMAIGMNKLKIFRMIMLETVILSLTGGIIGMVLSIFFIHIAHRNGIDFSMFAKGLANMGWDAFIYPYITFDYYVGLTILVIATGILSSLYPAKKALNLHPAEAVRAD